MDTTHLEYTAEDLIAHKLMRSGILVAKPKFDREGTDLLAFLEMKDGVKFCRIQCKGRSLAKSKSNVKISASYVTSGFVVFLYVEGSTTCSDVYCFLQSDIQGSWTKNPNDVYELSLPMGSYEEKLRRFRFDDTKVALIRSLIAQAEVSGEFKRLVYGGGDVQIPTLTANGSVNVTSPDYS